MLIIGKLRTAKFGISVGIVGIFVSCKDERINRKLVEIIINCAGILVGIKVGS